MKINDIIEEFYFRLSDAYEEDEVEDLSYEFQDYVKDKNEVEKFLEFCDKKLEDIADRIEYDAYINHQDWLSDQYLQRG